MESILSSIASNAPRYTAAEKAYLLDVCEKRERDFKDDCFNWYTRRELTGSSFLALPHKKAQELVLYSQKIKASVLTGNVVQTQNFAAQQEKVFRRQYLTMRDVAAKVLQHEGFTLSNIRYLKNNAWPRLAESDCEPADPPVILKMHPELDVFCRSFFTNGNPSTDFISADVFNKGYKPKLDVGIQVKMKDLVVEENKERANVTNGSITDSADKSKKELHEYVDAVRDGMNTVCVEADFPEPMETVSLRFPKRDDFRNPGEEYEALERNPSISSSVCSDNYDDQDFCVMFDAFPVEYTSDNE